MTREGLEVIRLITIPEASLWSRRVIAVLENGTVWFCDPNGVHYPTDDCPYQGLFMVE